MDATKTGPYVIRGEELLYVGSSGHPIRICGHDGRLAVAYDAEDGVLHRHGAEREVATWLADAKDKLSRSPSTAPLVEALRIAASDIRPEWVAEVNRCIATAGAVLGIGERLPGGRAEGVPLAL